MARKCEGGESDLGGCLCGTSRDLRFHSLFGDSSSDAEDLLQETASTLVAKFDEFRPGTDFLLGPFRVARYHVVHFRRRQRRDLLQFSDGVR